MIGLMADPGRVKEYCLYNDLGQSSWLLLIVEALTSRHDASRHCTLSKSPFPQRPYGQLLIQ
jgi:hypothetical protein